MIIYQVVIGYMACGKCGAAFHAAHKWISLIEPNTHVQRKNSKTHCPVHIFQPPEIYRSARHQSKGLDIKNQYLSGINQTALIRKLLIIGYLISIPCSNTTTTLLFNQ